MPRLRLRLKEGSDPQGVAAQLRNHVMMIDNALGALSAAAERDAYLDWAETATGRSGGSLMAPRDRGN
ncbi:MAG: hypothetical protein WAL64_06105 [Candidatus Dormiibacterota bacterium]